MQCIDLTYVRSLSIRSRKLLKRPRCAISPKVETEDQPTQYTLRSDPATYCHILYASCESSSDGSSEEELTIPREIRTSEIGGSGDDLIDGILAVNGVCFLSNKVR